MNPFLASDYSGIVEAFIWWGVNGFYLVMLLITAIGCIGRRHTRSNDDLTRSLVMGGYALLFSVLLAGWRMLPVRDPETALVEFGVCASISGGLWLIAWLLRIFVRS